MFTPAWVLERAGLYETSPSTFPSTSMPAPTFREGQDADEMRSSNDEDDDSISSDEDECVGPPPVVRLNCRVCACTLTSRGMQVWLVADVEKSLFSTDIPTDSVREGDPKLIPTCQCYACSVHCIGCDTVVGYHVRNPCEVCSSADHNGHFWLFESSEVTQNTREGVTWADLSYNGAEEEDAQRGEGLVPKGQEEEEEDTEADLDAEPACAVCTACPMWRPTQVAECRHVFCFGCISREVDMRGRCPLCRRPAMREGLQIL